MKKLFAILLTLAMLLGLAACGTSGGNGGGKVTIVGTWEGSVDISSAMGTLLQMELDTSLPISMTLTFKEDGTYTSAIDEDSIEDMMDSMVDLAIEMVIAMSGDPDMDLEAELAKEGMTMTDFKEQLMGQMNVEDMLGETETSGYYKHEDGKLYMVDEKEDLEEAIEENECTLITLTANKLTMVDAEQDGEKLSEVMPGLFPMVFTRK